jgi:8-oxo-dGTP pyrophosphatase MutT (NUDIX family)
MEIASGLLAFHKDSKRILLGLRTDLNCWSNFGGTFESDLDKTVSETAKREFKEETLCNVDYKMSKKPLDIYQDNFIRYYTYLALFDNMFEPTLNDEHKNYGWFKLTDLPSNIFPECLNTINKFKPELDKL